MLLKKLTLFCAISCAYSFCFSQSSQISSGCHQELQITPENFNEITQQGKLISLCSGEAYQGIELTITQLSIAKKQKLEVIKGLPSKSTETIMFDSDNTESRLRSNSIIRSEARCVTLDFSNIREHLYLSVKTSCYDLDKSNLNITKAKSPKAIRTH